ncbi:MAG: prephenate dehydrogenase/arogenate dehydrogenase family protein, partial [Selenomonadales bacterium]|jgi:prephenate dehydrogenase|nr:prephenate dehydrogenase/arogenate dehydrogenase family protein [Selenomonadales bacterium]
MAGIELSGIAAAKVDLFNNKFYIISPETAKNDASVQLVEAMVRAIGAIPTTLDLTHHDSCVAVISHVPHVAAAGLVNLLGCSPEDLEHNLKLAGGGFRDTTRIASSDADMWADICISNGKAIQKTLRSYQEMMGLIIDAIEDGDRQAIHSFFRTAKLRRDALLNETEAKTRREQ